MSLVRSLLVLAALAPAIGVISCKDERPATPPTTPTATGQAGQTGQTTYPAGYPTQGAPTTPPPENAQAAPGWPCTSDADLVCPFGRCVNGRCGGCSSGAQCKPNGTCAPTPWGFACVAQGFGPTQPTPPPTAPPTPPMPPPTAQPTPPLPPTADRFGPSRQSCVDRTNAYRARVGAKPVVRRPDREACSDAEAAGDSQANAAHATFGKCSQGSQNECPGYPAGSIEGALSTCLDQMFAEGPGEPYSAHGHYINMTNPAYSGVACGFYITPAGKLWITQNFFR